MLDRRLDIATVGEADFGRYDNDDDIMDLRYLVELVTDDLVDASTDTVAGDGALVNLFADNDSDTRCFATLIVSRFDYEIFVTGFSAIFVDVF